MPSLFTLEGLQEFSEMPSALVLQLYLHEKDTFELGLQHFEVLRQALEKSPVKKVTVEIQTRVMERIPELQKWDAGFKLKILVDERP
jgi:hypothetical protein